MHFYLNNESQIKSNIRNIDLTLTQKTLIGNNIGIEKSLLVSEESQRESIENQIISQKIETFEYKKNIESLKNEIENYTEEISNVKSNILVTEFDTKQIKDSILMNETFLSQVQEDILRQISIIESSKLQRDVIKRKVQQEKESLNIINNEVSLFMSDIKILKDNIKLKDIDCLESHKKIEEIKEDIDKSSNDQNNYELKLKELNLRHNTLKNTIMRTRYLCDVAETDYNQLKYENDRIESELRNLEKSSYNKDYEIKLLKEKCNILKITLNAMGETYNKQLNIQKDLTKDLKKDFELQKQLLEKTIHFKHLKKELINIEKKLTLEKGKVRALEEELETPMNIHRWRFLESTNPELMQLIKMKHSLQNSLITKLLSIQRYLNKLSNIKIQIKNNSKKIVKTSSQEVTDKIEFVEEILNQKLQLIQNFEKQIFNIKPNVEESKELVDVIREELRDEKTDLFEEKSKVDKIRTSVVVQKRLEERSQPPTHSENKFIGGGFAVSQSIKTSSIIETIKNPIIIPKINPSKSPKLLLPKGWNPIREPLKPFLPTVTGIRTSN